MLKAKKSYNQNEKGEDLESLIKHLLVGNFHIYSAHRVENDFALQKHSCCSPCIVLVHNETTRKTDKY